MDTSNGQKGKPDLATELRAVARLNQRAAPLSANEWETALTILFEYLATVFGLFSKPAQQLVYGENKWTPRFSNEVNEIGKAMVIGVVKYYHQACHAGLKLTGDHQHAIFLLGKDQMVYSMAFDEVKESWLWFRPTPLRNFIELALNLGDNNNGILKDMGLARIIFHGTAHRINDDADAWSAKAKQAVTAYSRLTDMCRMIEG